VRLDPKALIAETLAEIEREDALRTLAGLCASVRAAETLRSDVVQARARRVTGRPVLT
jgi:hypothetical protein